jgi:hypothetical protein
MDDLRRYVAGNTQAFEDADTPQGAIDVGFFNVVASPDVSPEILRSLVESNFQGDYRNMNPFDGGRHDFMELGAWIGDQGLAIRFIALAAHTKLAALDAPDSSWARGTKKGLASSGMLAIQAPQPKV